MKMNDGIEVNFTTSNNSNRVTVIRCSKTLSTSSLTFGELVEVLAGALLGDSIPYVREEEADVLSAQVRSDIKALERTIGMLKIELE